MTEMPKDWWPECVTVTGKSSEVELAFCFFDTSHEVKETKWYDNPPMLALRENIWRALHDADFRKDIMGK
jgi:hypothetical protein